MPLVVSSREETIVGNKRLITGALAFDSSYPTGGEALAASLLGLQKIDFLLAHPTKGVSFEYDYANAKLLAYVPGVTVGAAGAVVIDDFPTSGVGADAFSLGLGTGSTTHRFGVEKEVANAADLSTITGVRFFALGS